MALDWCDQNPLKKLARKSFELHKELEKELGPDVGYRAMDTLSVSTGTSRTDSSLPSWIDGKVEHSDVIGTESSTAQCHPKLLTKGLLDAAVQGGAKLVIGKVSGIKLADNGKDVEGVRVDDKILDADAVIVTMGPWSGQASAWLPKAGIPKIGGGRAHSIVLDTSGKDITAHALFASVDGRDCEVYPRPDGTVYSCGNDDQEPLPEDPKDVLPKQSSCDELVKRVAKISSSLEGCPVITSQACYLPHTPDGIPMIGKLGFYEGAYIATGHTCWGILNGPATGLGMAELILDGKVKSVDFGEYNPGRF